MNWFELQRQNWIRETIMIFGFIQRQHLMKKFGISMPQASADLQKFKSNNPTLIQYDLSRKMYVQILTEITDVIAEGP